MSATLELVKLLDGGNTCLYRLQVGGETGVNGAGFEVASRSFQEAPEGLPAETTTTSSGASDGAVVAVVQPKSIAEVLGVRVGDWVGLKEDDGTVQLACFETAANMIQEGHSTVILLRKFPAVVETHIESDSPTNVEVTQGHGTRIDHESDVRDSKEDEVEVTNEPSSRFYETRKQRMAWDAMYEKLKQYKSQNGHTNVPLKYEADKKLGRWVNRQRLRRTAGTLLSRRFELLTKVGFCWSDEATSKAGGETSPSKKALVSLDSDELSI